MSFLRNLLNEASEALLRRLQGRSSRNSPCSPQCPSTSQAGIMDNICHNPEHLSDWHAHEIHQFQSLCSGSLASWIVPVGGNAFMCSSNSSNIPLVNSSNQITEKGLVNWNSSESKLRLYIHCVQTGVYHLGLRLQVPGKNTSRIRVSFVSCTNDKDCAIPQTHDIALTGTNDKVYQIVSCGKFTISKAGYILIDLLGIQKSGSVFANISHAMLIPESVDNGEESSAREKRSLPQSPTNQIQSLPKTTINFVSDPNDFYFGRRGPSVHLQYLIGDSGTDHNIQYFYNELMVPTGQDIVGAYFCAIGFSGGYFGIQVNSATERRILFSVWSAYETDNPKAIPKDFKVSLQKRGSRDVHVGEFGNEGSGGQSYLKYFWKSNRVYKFIVQAKPLDNDNTEFSAWFCESDGDGVADEWKLIASFRKPKVSTFLKGLYSFSENFIPEMGHVERYCVFGNQWAWDSVGGEWVEVTKVQYTADSTAMKGNRKDIAAGLVDGGSGFYLRNCGFFSDYVEPGQEFCRNNCGSPPQIDFSSLP